MKRMKHSILIVLIGLSLATVASDVVASDDNSGLEDELARVEAQLAEVTAERDALLAEREAVVTRFERSKATQQLVFDIIADPAVYGTQEEVLDLLDTLAVPGTIYGDDAFGPASWRGGWRNTLFGGVDAIIHTWKSWLAEDGSGGGSMWTWSGTARNGERFDLQGINLDTYDENGTQTSVMVYYPYEDAEVKRRFYEGNSVQE